MKNTKLFIIILTLVVFGAFLTGCSNKPAVDSSVEDNKQVIKLGVNGSENEVWSHIKNELEKEGITLEVVSFGDYTRPNIALAEGEIDINSFQHYAFFDKFKEERDLDLTAIGETIIAPLGLYSEKIKDVSQLKKGDKVAIPNDETNGGRSLVLLQTAGLINLDPQSGHIPNQKDIVENKLNLEFIEVDASNTERTLGDVTIAAINSGMAVDAGLLPSKDSIFLEPVDENSKPYINIIAARTEDKDNEAYKRVVELYRTDEVEKIVEELYKGSQKITW
ncbi:MAG: MetQ/NlpA family ABC transporter substrate-binding protein [Tissierella sp.]|uniref:MetQ/NlpA family ABC transporter substrate-binding protein n=1 Tax=Tissierella sp. TaxID=41274 RepID=UPI003F96EA2A